MKDFEQEDVGLLALSVDPLEKATETVEELKLDFPVAYGLVMPKDADPIGAFWEERRGIFHATNFILDSDKKVVQASYSTGPVGRIVAEGRLEPYPVSEKEKAADVTRYRIPEQSPQLAPNGSVRKFLRTGTQPVPWISIPGVTGSCKSKHLQGYPRCSLAPCARPRRFGTPTPTGDLP